MQRLTLNGVYSEEEIDTCLTEKEKLRPMVVDRRIREAPVVAGGRREALVVARVVSSSVRSLKDENEEVRISHVPLNRIDPTRYGPNPKLPNPQGPHFIGPKLSKPKPAPHGTFTGQARGSRSNCHPYI